jgi:hypothetical protein
MFETQDYSTFPLEELKNEEKKISNLLTFSNIFIGACVGIMIYSVASKGFSFLAIVLPILIISGMVKGGQKLKENRDKIQVEMTRRAS